MVKLKPVFLTISLCAALACTTVSAQIKTTIHNRITSEIDDQTVQSLHGTQHPAANLHLDLGRVASDTQLDRVSIVFKLSDQQQRELNALLAQQLDPTSPNYHKWLAPGEYQSRFGVSDADLAKVKEWVRSQGLEVIEESSDHSQLVFRGPAASVEHVFHTELHHYLTASGETHFANATDLQIPAALSNVVLGVRSLNDFHPQPRVQAHVVHPLFTSSVSHNHFVAPDDFATIYDLKALYNAGVTGAGQSIAVVGQSDVAISDTTQFRAVSGLPSSDPLIILVPGSPDPGVVKGDVDESNLDIQWSGAVAPGATIIFVNSKNGAFDSLQYAIQQDIAPVIGVSYGDCEGSGNGSPGFLNSEMNTFQALFQQGSAQGQTITVASGDAGAADCDGALKSATHGFSVDFPSSSPNTTSIGGTTFDEGSTPAAFWSATNNSNNGSALAYIPEVSWNDTAAAIADGGTLSASGGGKSRFFPKPSWQTGVGVPADGARDIPDVAFAASNRHDGYLSCSQGSCVSGYRAADNTLTVVGGTSVGAPAFAGLVALLNQKTGISQGNINPAIYSLAAISTDAFHDITSGDNKVPCTSGTTACPSGTTSIGFTAASGYDLVTGWGSLDGANFVNEIAQSQAVLAVPDFHLTANSSRMVLTRATSTTPSSPATDVITVSAVNGFSGTVSLTCTVSTSLTNTTCSISPASVSGSGTAGLTITTKPLAFNHLPANLPGNPTPENLPGSWWWSSGLTGLAAVVFVRRPKGLKAAQAFLMLTLVGVLIVAVGCGGGGSSTPTTTTTGNSTTTTTPTPTNGTITVSGSSGGTVHNIQIAVTVN